MNRLMRPKERCPLHGRRDCCGRSEYVRYAQPRHASERTWVKVRPGLFRSTDGREKCSKAEMKRRKDRMLRENPICGACGEGFKDYYDVELSHRESKGIGGARRDDSLPNLYLMHTRGNRAQGSRDLEEYLADCKLRGVGPCPENFS